jgi:flagellar hook-associated protein 2
MMNNVGFNNMWANSGMFSASFMPGQRGNVSNFRNPSWDSGGMGGFLPPQSANFLVQSRMAAEDLRTATSQLVGRDSVATFARSSGVSSDEDVLRVSSVNASRVGAGQDIRVNVEQVALAQRNEGASLVANANAVNAGFTAGQNTIEIQAGGTTRNISFNVGANDSVRDVQQRMATAVNNANLGVTASVATTSGNSTLTFASSETGVRVEGQDNFAVRDMTGNAAWFTGVDTMTQGAQNALFRVDFTTSTGDFITGNLRESRSNNVDIGSGTTVELREEGTATVSFEQNLTGIQNAARDMVNGFNRLFELAMDNRNDRRTNALFNQMQGLLNTHANALSNIGITRNQHGFLNINAERMQQAAESGALENFFQRNGNQQSFGFTNRLSRIAEDVARSPERFTSGVDAMDGMQGMGFNAFTHNRMNHFMGMGLLLNMML